MLLEIEDCNGEGFTSANLWVKFKKHTIGDAHHTTYFLRGDYRDCERFIDDGIRTVFLYTMKDGSEIHIEDAWFKSGGFRLTRNEAVKIWEDMTSSGFEVM